MTSDLLLDSLFNIYLPCIYTCKVKREFDITDCSHILNFPCLLGLGDIEN